MRWHACTLAWALALGCDISDPIPFHRPDAGASCPLRTVNSRALVWIDTDCVPGHNEGTTLQIDCELSITADVPRTLPPLEGSLLDVIEGIGIHGCRPELGPPAAFLSLGCQTQDERRCSIDLYERAEHRLGLGVERLPLHDPPYPYQMPSDRPALTTADPMKGYLAGVAPLGAGLVIASRERAFSSGACTDTTAPGRFLFVDPSGPALTITATAPAPPCLQRLAADPSGGFFATYGPKDHLDLGRFDARGRLSQSVRLVETTTTVSMAIEVDDTSVYVARENFDSAIFDGVVNIIDRATLSQVRALQEVGAPGEHLHRPRALLRDGDRLLVADDNTESLTVFRVPGLGVVGSTLLNTPPVASGSAGYLTRHPRRNELYVSAPEGLNGELWILTATASGPPQVLGHRSYFPMVSNPWATIMDGERLLVGLTEDHHLSERPQAFISVFDPVERRYQDGKEIIGLGLVSALIRIDAHHLVALLPYEDVLVRLTVP